MLLSYSHNADKPDPAKILADMMESRSFQGVPVFISDIDHIEDLAHLTRKIDGRSNAHKFNRLINLLRHPLEHSIARKQSPIVFAGCSGIVFLSPRKDRLDHLLKTRMDLARDNDDPLIGNNAEWSLSLLFHELAHLIGAGEPQADKISALFCRRLMPGTSAPAIMADIRAVTAIISATALATHRTKNARDAVLDHLKLYGWQMVQAGDSALALPAHTVTTMTDAEIVGCRFERYDPCPSAILELGTMAKDTRLSSLFSSRHIQDVVAGARELVEKTACSRTSEVHVMARRIALGARRLAEGEKAYKGFMLSGWVALCSF